VSGSVAVFEGGVRRALAVLGGVDASACDPLLDASGTALALDGLAKGESLLLRLAPELGPARAGFGPVPKPPFWGRLTRGSPTLSLAPLVAVDGAREDRFRVREVVIEAEDGPCCDGPSCKERKSIARAWLVSEGRRLLVAERRAETSLALAAVVRLGARFADALGVALSSNDSEEATDRAVDAPPPRGPVSALALARYALRTEGDRLVLRDHGRPGPRALVPRHMGLSALFALPALLGWGLLAQGLGEGRALGETLGLGAAAALFSLAAYAFFGVGRFASAYSAQSLPVLALYPGRVAPLPWVARDGAVELRHDGRFGAAFPPDEVTAFVTRTTSAGVAVDVDGDHGPIELACELTPEVAALLAAALERSVSEVAHPAPRGGGRAKLRERRARAS
jgi:hypothetical protein